MKLMHLLAAATMILLLGADCSMARDRTIPHKIEAAIRGEYRAAHKHVPLSPEERKELEGWLQEAVGKGMVPIVQTNEHDLRGLDLLNRDTGHPPRSHLLQVLGGVHKLAPKLDQCDAFWKQHQGSGLFTDSGFVGNPNDGVLTAATLQSAARFSSLKLGSHLTVYDSNRRFVTEGSQLVAGKPILEIRAPAHHGTVTPVREPMSIAIFTIYMQDGTPCPERFEMLVGPPPQEIAVSAPNNTHNRKTVLCLNRGDPQPPTWPTPCDFGPFPQAGIDPTGADVVVPMAGTIKVPGVLLTKDGKIDADLIVTAINTQNGTACQGQDKDLGLQVLAQTKVVGQNTATWSILGNSALKFGRTCYQQHSGLAFNMTWNLRVKGQDNNIRTVLAIVSNTQGQHSVNKLLVQPVDLQWGCLPGGTLVTLANGSRKAIEDITRDDLVRGPDGKPWQVFAHTKGHDAALIEVRAEDGTVARMTTEHPVITGRDHYGRLRWTTASRLTVGMALITVKGPSKVAAVERVAYRGAVYNMALRPLGTEKAPARGSAFYADGLLVGDQTMQGLPVANPDTVAAASSRAEAK
jgi:hypothetical protein